jgi:teichuronic acid biosynthesis glycosyltransferase TuaC
MSEVSVRVLMITNEWPTPEHPEWGPFIVQQVEYLRKAGVDVEVFSFHGKGNPINYLRAWLRLRRLHDMQQFDLIHAQFGQSGLVALPSRLPMIVTCWGSDLQGIVGANGRYTVAGRVLQLLSRYVARHAKEIIVVSERLAKCLPHGLPVHVIPHGVDLDRFRPIPQPEARRQLRLPLDKRLVLFAALNPREPVKRHHLAQEAVALLRTQFDVELVTVSGVPHELVPVYMNACDVLVVTSRHEGSPTVVKEALACNLPVVSVDVGDVRQRIEGVQGCVLCADDSPETIAEGLAQVLRVRSRIRGRDTVADLDVRVVAQRIIEVYRSALVENKRA